MPYPTYCTQLDSTGNGHYRCGGASLASCLLDDGWQSDPWQLTVQLSDQYGWTDAGCTSDQLLAAADEHGLAGRKWTDWDDAFVALAGGEAVLALLNNRYITPRPYPFGSGWESLHWIRIVALSDRDDMAYCYDPLCYMQESSGGFYQGPTASTQEGLTGGIQTNGWPEAGVILTSRAGRPLNLKTPA